MFKNHRLNPEKAIKPKFRREFEVLKTMRCIVFIDVSSAYKIGTGDNTELLTLIQNRNESCSDAINFRFIIDS